MPVVLKPLTGDAKPMAKPKTQGKRKGLPPQKQVHAKAKARYTSLHKAS